MVISRRVDILLVEDNSGDIKLITEALSESSLNPKVFSIRNGTEALRFLRNEPPFQDASRPAIIILDLNLPGKEGRAVLAEIKSDPVLAAIPVIIFSGSDAPQDISTCYALHANCYIVKPRDMDGLSATLQSLADFWLQRVNFPPDPMSQVRGGESK